MVFWRGESGLWDEEKEVKTRRSMLTEANISLRSGWQVEGKMRRHENANQRKIWLGNCLLRGKRNNFSDFALKWSP